MNLYVAAKANAWRLARQVAEQLERDGHRITYKWWLHGLRNMVGDRAIAGAVADICAVRAADAVVLVLDQSRAYRGAYVEMGAALGLGKRVYVVGDYRPPMIFMYHPLVEFGWPKPERRAERWSGGSARARRGTTTATSRTRKGSCRS